MSKGLNTRTLSLLAIGAFVLGGGAIYLQYNSMVEAEAKANALDDEVPDREELEKSLSEAVARKKTLETELVHLETGVHELAYIPTLLKEIETLGNSAKVKVTGVRPMPPPALPPGVMPEKKAYETVEIDLTGKGDYQSIITMVDLLRNFPKIVAVQTMNLTPRTDNGGTRYSHIDTQIRLRAFVFPVNQPDQNKTLEVASKQGGSS
jgi:Tfp pilus assembly protein PilO